MNDDEIFDDLKLTEITSIDDNKTTFVIFNIKGSLKYIWPQPSAYYIINDKYDDTVSRIRAIQDAVEYVKTLAKNKQDNQPYWDVETKKWKYE